MERLFAVSKVLLDYTLLKLKTENEALKLSLFWRDHNLDRLRDCFEWIFTEGTPLMCGCHWCHNRMDYIRKDESTDKDCKLAPYVTQIAGDFGLNVAVVTDRKSMQPVRNEAAGTYFVHDGNGLEDAHLIRYINNAENPKWSYGPRLWKATSHTDEELQKLQRFFLYMNRGRDEPPEECWTTDEEEY